MEHSEHWSTILANIVTSFGILSLIGLLIAYRQTQNQFKFTVMLSCIDRFQQLIPVVRNDDQDIERLKKYIDLTNEELFYFQRHYIPKEVMIEWLDSICDLVPIYEKDSKLPLNYEQWTVKQIHDQNLLQGYPRLLKAFTLDQKKINHNNKLTLIKLITTNLGIKTKSKHFKRALFDNYGD